MSSPEGTKIQINFKPQARLDNIYASSLEELDMLLAGYADRVPMINAIENIATSGVAGAITPPSVVSPVSAPAAPAPTPQAAPAPTGNTCKHGPMTYREGSGKRGPWKGYFCPSPKGTPDQCEPQFVR